MKYILMLSMLLGTAVGLQAQKFNAAESACGHQQVLMESTAGKYHLFFSPKQVSQQLAAEIGKDVYIVSEHTPTHVLQYPLRPQDVKKTLDIWQDFQRSEILLRGEQEFFVFFTSISVGRTHVDRECPAKGSWYALILKGISVQGNKALLKALQADNWQAELAKVVFGRKGQEYTILLEPLCADEYGGENCMFVM